MQNSHILQGVDPVVVRMAIAAPMYAPQWLKARIVRAAKQAAGKDRLSVSELLTEFQSRARENGYELVLVQDDVKRHASFAFQELKKIIEEVADKYDVSVNEIKSPSRVRAIVKPRQEFFYRAKTETLKSYPEIAQFCGGRDHTTVIHAVNKFASDNDFPLPHKAGSYGRVKQENTQ